MKNFLLACIIGVIVFPFILKVYILPEPQTPHEQELFKHGMMFVHIVSLALALLFTHLRNRVQDDSDDE